MMVQRLADIYGMGRNETLVGRAIEGRRDQVVLATKFGNVRGTIGEFLGIRGDPKYVRECCDASLEWLCVDTTSLHAAFCNKSPPPDSRWRRHCQRRFFS